MASNADDAWDSKGHVIPFHLAPGIVVASFFVSLIGTITTVELLHRRTAGTGWVKWIQLFAPSVSMGLIGIWCMHYVGNRAIVLGNGEPELQLIYSRGVTAASSFIPVIALFVAYLIADLRYRGKKLMAASLVLSGVSAGLAIAGMHYVGNLGVSNYNISFKPAYVGGAISIACVGCVLALASLFMLQEFWISHLLSRLVCAVVLAGAVSGMHFEASMGTTYHLKFVQKDGNSNARNVNVIIATVLSLLTIPACAAIAVSVSRRRRQLADRAQQVVLACARFDPDGKLMVTREGLLPCQKITADQGAFEDEFNVSHSAFHWIFRVSHNWACITKWLPGMRSHLSFLKGSQNHRKSGKSEDEDSQFSAAHNALENYSIIFRESFCVAAANLAAQLKLDISELGILYDGVMMTGTLPGYIHGRSNSLLSRLKIKSQSKLQDLEANFGAKLFGKGQLLFLVQQVDKKTASHYMSQGYRFVATEKVQSQLAHTMQVPLHTITTQMTRLRTYASSQYGTQLSGTLLGCFALRVGLSEQPWEVLVPKSHPAELPVVQLSPHCLFPPTSNVLGQLHGLSVTACVDWLSVQINSTNDGSVAFLRHLKKCIMHLLEEVPEPWFRQAIFSAKPVYLPIADTIHHPTVGNDNVFRQPGCMETRQGTYCANATMYSFHIIPDVHASSLKSSVADANLQYTPLSFFKCRQQIVPGSGEAAQHLVHFERNIYREFAPIFSQFSHVGAPESFRDTYDFDQGNTDPFSSLPLRGSAHRDSISTHASKQLTYPPSAWMPQGRTKKSLKQALSSYKISNAFSSRKSLPPRSESLGHLPSSSPPMGSTSEKGDSLHSRQNSHSDSYSMNAFPYGGIIVSSDVTVEHEESDVEGANETPVIGTSSGTPHYNGGFGPQAALGQGATGTWVGPESDPFAKSGTTGQASVADTEDWTFVNELVSFAVKTWKKS